MTNKIRRKLDYWQKTLGLEGYQVVFERHHKLQMTRENGEPGCNIVGVNKEEGVITIFATRPLREDDVVHELLHVKYPEETDHNWIVEETANLIVSRDGNYIEGGYPLASSERML